MKGLNLLDYWKLLNYVFNEKDMLEDGLNAEDALNLIECQEYYVFNETVCVVTTDGNTAYLLIAKDGKIVSAKEVPISIIERKV